jgi:hypothetical protein
MLLFTSPAFSQFGQSNNRLVDLADRLSRDASDFADSSYSNFTNNSRALRNDIDAVMLAHQFAGATRIFYRMVVDRRRNQDLRDAFDTLQNLARSVGRSGRMTWRGRVDDDVRIRIRGGSADVETIGGTPYYDGQPNFFNSLPSRRVTVRLTMKRGRGEIFIEQQPSRENDFTAVVRIRDSRGGASDYEFELQW